MLKPLIEFFLLLSTDKKTITSNNITTFYQFITKKLPEIDMHRPNLIISSLNKTNLNNNNKVNLPSKKIEGDFYKSDDITNTNKLNKNIIINNFQNELLSLFNDMIEYLYEENILILSNDKKVILKNKINKKLIEKNIIFSRNKSMNNILIQDIKIKEIRNYIIDLINNNHFNDGLISLNFTIKHFINFFNTKNKDKNRNIVKQFINIINPIIKAYKTDKKISYHKKVNKNKTKSLSKLSIINIENNNMFKEKTENNKKIKNNNINNYFHKINNSFNNNKREKERFNINNIIIKNYKRNTVYKKDPGISNNNENLKEQNISHDTIPCQTLNNCISFNNIQKNSLIENYLSNNIKNHNLYINYKDNNKNSKKIIINKIKNFHSKSQINNFKKKNKNYYIKSKSTITSLYNNDFNEFKEKIWKNRLNDEHNYFDDFNTEKFMEKRKTNITCESKKEDDLKEKYIGCTIY